MNSITANPSAADFIARQLIQERVQDAERRSQVRALRTARRAARQATGPVRVVTPPATHTLPWWAFRFLFPAR